MAIPVRSLAAGALAGLVSVLAACAAPAPPVTSPGPPVVPPGPVQAVPVGTPGVMLPPPKGATPEIPGSSAGQPAPAPVATVPAEVARLVVDGFVYDPRELRVRAGTRIVIEGLDNVGHTVTARDGSFSFDLGRGDRAELVLEVPGTYEYFCEYHRSMRGVIVVE